MKVITLLPADTYTVINKTILTSQDQKNIISLYEPIIGSVAVSLYLTLWNDLDTLEIMSKDFNHHHLMTILKSNLETIKEARKALEGVGLLRTYFKYADVNNYVYELYSPLSPKEFFLHPIFNVTLYNNIGKKEYENIKNKYQVTKEALKDYEEITETMDSTFKSISSNILLEDIDNIKGINNNKNLVSSIIDFDLLFSSLPKGIINEKTVNKKTKDLINELAFIYNYDTLKMCEMLRLVINENGCIDKENLRRIVRKYYQYDNGGALPTLIYRSQPEYLKTPVGDESNRGKMICVFENTSPYDFLKSKYKGGKPTARDLKILEYLIVDLGLKPAVTNVLIDYILRINDRKLTQGFVETIAGQWKRLGIETASEAMEIAEKEHKKYNKNKSTPKKVKTPVWFDENIKKEAVSDEELKELEDMLKEFR
ncbi:MAG TPA: DnaD domain protein [Bacilli bacterium]|nr:DnaD domain protein [Bacilli bacterium]